MPPTTTGRTRSNRPDTRPSERRRRASGRRQQAQQTVQDLRVTRKRRPERAEREVQATALRSHTAVERRVRAMRKRLRAIERLVEAEGRGEELDPQQRAKVDSLEGLLGELATLTAEPGGVPREE